ncbi:MAG TPA: hypothetical protein VFD58_00455 [Blastocatellia bacterium]|nr:hypothetical protein [Blastocatellia bacterium]
MIPASKKRNLPRRNAERPGSMRVFEYWCEPIPDASGNLPQQLWDAAHEMQAVWNRMTEAFREVTAPHAEDYKARRAAVQALDLKRIRAVAMQSRGVIPSRYYYHLADRFALTLKGYQRRQRERGAGPSHGAPRFKGRLESLAIPEIFSRCVGDEVRWSQLFTGELPVRMRRMSRAGEARGEFRVSHGGVNAAVRLKVRLHREPAPNAIVKRVTLCGRYERSLGAHLAGWRWGLKFLIHEEDDSHYLREETGVVMKK